MCRYCAAGFFRSPADRSRILDLVALVEHPDALPAEAALRIASELLAWAEQPKSGLRCEVVAAVRSPVDNLA
jgi:hypothetical protein